MSNVPRGPAPAVPDRRARRRQETIEEILDIAQQVMAEDGVNGLSLSEVARRLGVQPPSLYKYFDSLMDVYDALFRRGQVAHLETLRAAIDKAEPGLDTLHTIFETSGRWCLANSPIAQLLFWRPVPSFEPSADSMAPSVEMIQLRARRPRRRRRRRRARSQCRLRRSHPRSVDLHQWCHRPSDRQRTGGPLGHRALHTAAVKADRRARPAVPPSRHRKACRPAQQLPRCVAPAVRRRRGRSAREQRLVEVAPHHPVGSSRRPDEERGAGSSALHAVAPELPLLVGDERRHRC